MDQSATNGAAGLPRFRLPALRAPLQTALIVAVAYFVGAETAFFIGTLSDEIFAPFWPPNVILFCAFVVVPERRWWTVIAAAFPAHVAAELTIGMSAGQIVVAFATNVAVAVLNTAALRRLAGPRPWLTDLRKTAVYVLVTAGVAPALVALAGAFVQITGGGAVEKYWLYWTYWFVSNALSSLTLGPVFLSWTSDSPKSSGFAQFRHKAEASILGAALVVVCTLAFEASAGKVGSGFLPAILYSPLPLILWATIRFGAKGASTGILIVTVALTWRALKGPSLFIGDDPETNVLALQVFLIGLSVPVLLLGAALDGLRHAGETMRALTGSVLTAQDEERRRIARELHDSTGQNLIAASMLIARITKMLPDAAAPVATQLDGMVQQSIHELRTMSYVLHPPLLDEAGLKLALQHYVDGFCERSGLTVDLDISPEFERLQPDVELTLFRVVQEALTNVSRHSDSATAEIRLGRGVIAGDPKVILTIQNAVRRFYRPLGFSGLVARRLSRKDGIGLASMRERLHQIGGSLDIDFGPEKTTVRAIAPFVDHEPQGG